MENGGFLYTASHDEENSIGDKSEHGKDGPESEPAGEADEFDHLLGGFGEEGFFGPGVGGLLIGFEGFVGLSGDRLKLIGGIHFNIELRDDPKSDTGGLLEEGKMHVGDVFILGRVGGDNACDGDVDADGFKFVTG